MTIVYILYMLSSIRVVNFFYFLFFIPRIDRTNMLLWDKKVISFIFIRLESNISVTYKVRSNFPFKGWKSFYTLRVKFFPGKWVHRVCIFLFLFFFFFFFYNSNDVICISLKFIHELLPEVEYSTDLSSRGVNKIARSILISP